MKYCVLVLICWFGNTAYGQEKPVLVFDLINNTLDSIPTVDYDTSILRENTVHHVGRFSSHPEDLDTSIPTSNVYSGSQFTRKKRASLDFDLNRFPIRTAVKIFRFHNDSLDDLCSGSMISKKHVLTAAHCVSFRDSNRLYGDTLYISPVFDNGVFNCNFPGSFVTKVYIFKNWRLQGEDMAVLELAEPIGESTGWLSIGFDNDNSSMQEGIFYKFSYPATPFLPLDSNVYNGDTLYYYYGVIDNLSPHRISINNTSGIGGESGSSIIKIQNGEKYITYGVLSLTTNLNHSRINNWRYFAIKSIINDDLTVAEGERLNDILVYPNPTSGILRITRMTDIEVLDLTLFDNLGKACRVKESEDACLSVDLSDLPDGVYVINLTTSMGFISKRIIKSSL